jgi:hypothetical protein
MGSRKKKKLVPIRTEDELKKVLFLQQTITRAAEKELLAAAMLNPDPEKYILAGRDLLDKYAKHPTLSEFVKNPKLSNVYKWGATFGVAALIGGLVVESVKALQPRLAPSLRRMFLLLLKELDQPTHVNFTAFLWIELRLQFNKDNLSYAAMETDLKNTIETLATVSSMYGLVTRNGDRTALTPTGKRVLMHLVDTAQFIDEMAQAHAEFQTEFQNKPVA